MNGRIYDPTLGRFLQADPHIQAPMNSQSYNRYSYVLNNPLSYTDPSGYFFDKLFKGINKVLGDFAPFVAAALMFIPGVGQWAAASMWNAAVVGFVSGGIATGSLKGALIGAFTGAAFQQIGAHFNKIGAENLNSVAWEGGQIGDFVDFGGNLLTKGQVAGQIASHAVTGGVISTLSGGKFGHGFFSAGVTKGVGGAYLPGGSDLSSGEIARGTVVSAVVGGTASVISGGKFANGARTSAFQYLFNTVSKAMQRKYAVKNAIKNARDTYNANKSLGNREAGISVGTYVYQYDGEAEYRYDHKAKALSTLGYDVDSGPMAGYGSPNIDSWVRQNRQVSDWIIALGPDDTFNRFATAVDLGISSVYTWQSSTNTTLHYSYDSANNSWGCSVYSGSGGC